MGGQIIVAFNWVGVVLLSIGAILVAVAASFKAIDAIIYYLRKMGR